MKKRLKDFVLIMGYSIFMIITSVMLLFFNREFVKENVEDIMCFEKNTDEEMKSSLNFIFCLFLLFTIFMILFLIFNIIICFLLSILFFILLIIGIYTSSIKPFQNRD